MFDKFKNQQFSELALITDISNLVKKRDLEPGQDRVPIRTMRIFQAIVTELFPKLQGAPFEKKVSEYENIWGKGSIDFEDSKRLHELFGVGIQAWVKKELADRHYTSRKIFDTAYSKKVRILVQEKNEKESFSVKDQIGYIFDEVALQYYSCPNKGCLFGINRYDRLQNHISKCRTETKVTYTQKKYEKSDNKLREELAAEGILPDAKYENMMFSTFDIGN